MQFYPHFSVWNTLNVTRLENCKVSAQSESPSSLCSPMGTQGLAHTSDRKFYHSMATNSYKKRTVFLFIIMFSWERQAFLTWDVDRSFLHAYAMWNTCISHDLRYNVCFLFFLLGCHLLHIYFSSWFTSSARQFIFITCYVFFILFFRFMFSCSNH